MGTSKNIIISNIVNRWIKGSVVRRTVHRPIHAVSAVIVLLIILMAITAPLISTHDPVDVNLREIHEGPSLNHWLGTDDLGRDLASRLFFGARVSIQVGFIAVGIAVGLGTPIGLLAGFRGGLVDEIIMRIMDAILVIPALVLALGITAALGAGLNNVMMAIGFTNIPIYARLTRGQVLAAREFDYVTAARATGVGGIRIAFRHILPNTFAPIIVSGAIAVSFAILTEAALSFLGVGIPPPAPSWGSMLQLGAEFMEENPIESFAPGIAIFITVLAVNLLGDGLREGLDPKLRGR
ncbi:MAG: hypothetical protein BZY82_04460 [SAR202 cluster bacterium Io17-Chloro-G3]|nr:MAG: hypothetical protein BZY82_04460 [SAR202 cluster bacterium Io17-Chloro-G3]